MPGRSVDVRRRENPREGTRAIGGRSLVINSRACNGGIVLLSVPGSGVTVFKARGSRL